MTFSLILSAVAYPPFGATGESEDDHGYPVSLSGLFNAREMVYLDGRTAYDYLLIADTKTRDNTSRYLLQFDENDTWHESDLLNTVGSEVRIDGYLRNEETNDGGDQAQSPETAGAVQSAATTEQAIVVRSIEILDARTESDVSVKSTSQAMPDTTVINQVVLPARYSDKNFTPHSKEYYSSQFHTDGEFSLAAYWRDASYGRLLLDGEVADWVDLPATEEYYFDFGSREADLVAAADKQVDFDGTDNWIDNNSVENIRMSSDSDDIDSVIGIFNGAIGNSIAGYSYLAPLELTTDEGSLYAYFIAISDTGYGSPSGLPSNYFVGLAAHEMGHNFGWHHTATALCVYCDPWSLMSGGIYSDLGPSGPIASHRERQGWIEPDDIVFVDRAAAETEEKIEFSLEMLGRPPGEGYLMAKVPFGDAGHYYTLEARKNTVNDHTPMEQSGIVIYHFSPTGHADSLEPRSQESIVDTAGNGDLMNANLAPGESFVDSKNNIAITNLGEVSDTITVQVVLGVGRSGHLGGLCAGLEPTITGTIGDDIIIGTAGKDVISALGGNDVINGMGGDDTVCGGHGDDLIDGGDGDDILVGNFGSDSIIGGQGNDRLVGGRGDDRLEGSEGNDILEGWSGNDLLTGEKGNDALYGGHGDDYLLGGTGEDKLRGWLGDDTYADKKDNGA